MVVVPEDSPLDGKTLVESRIGSAFGLGVLGIGRGGEHHLMPSPEEVLKAGDTLYVKGRPEDLQAVEGLRSLEIASDDTVRIEELESEEVGLAEVVLSPRTSLAGKTLRELHFRDKFGLTVVAISSQGRVHRTRLRRRPLRFGDALLLYGPRRRLKVLGTEPDFLVLTEEAQQPVRKEKAPLAALIMAAVLLPVMLGWLPIYISAVAGATLMVLSRCLSMDEAYRFIEWRAVFLIAGMLPLGMALEQTGAADLVTGKVVDAVGGFGPLALVAGLYVLAALAAQMMPTAAVAILMAPIALNTALSLGLSPSALLMTISLSASASFLSPVAHPANTLIMGPGGYRFTDYIKVGAPLTLFCLIVVLLVLPLVWPLTP
ncbi:MAG: SLC13 family permease [Thermoanaerobaculia bacterium]|nr:SLC13 family permease [Thermoanaerobaculia bacterium]